MRSGGSRRLSISERSSSRYDAAYRSDLDDGSSASPLKNLVPMAPHASGGELQRLSSFYTLLNHASASRSERAVMRVFVEALAVWQDAESWAYVADVAGRYSLDLCLPGSDRARVPPVLDPALLTADISSPTRISLDSSQALGFRGTPDLLVARVRGASDWLIVTERAGDVEADIRLGVYVHAAEQTLSEIKAARASRLTWAMLEHLLPTGASLEDAVERAIAELASSVEAAASLTVSSKDGVRVLTVGDPSSRLSRPLPVRLSTELVVSIEVIAPYVATIGIRSVGGLSLTGREEHLLGIAASTLGTWLNTVLDRLSSQTEYRKSSRSFDRVLKRRIDGALAENTPVSLIVASFDRDVPRSEVAHDFIGRIRRKVRLADLAGRLSSGHIVVLLPDTPSDNAGTVVERLRLLLAADLPPGQTGISVDLARLPAAYTDH